MIRTTRVAPKSVPPWKQNESAVEDLVMLCDRIVDDQEEIDSYRLLKFDKDGIHVLSPDDYRRFDHDLRGRPLGLLLGLERGSPRGL